MVHGEIPWRNIVEKTYYFYCQSSTCGPFKNFQSVESSWKKRDIVKERHAQKFSKCWKYHGEKSIEENTLFEDLFSSTY